MRSDNGINNVTFEQQPGVLQQQDSNASLASFTLSQPQGGSTLQLAQPSPVSGMQASGLNGNGNQCKWYNR